MESVAPANVAAEESKVASASAPVKMASKMTTDKVPPVLFNLQCNVRLRPLGAGIADQAAAAAGSDSV
jgi:hypothetical protein